VIARLITIVVVASLCLFTATRGWSIVEFTRADQRASGAKGEAMRAWAGVPAVTTTALDAALDDMAQAGGTMAAQLRTDLLIQSLAVRPLSSIAWLSLAGMRLVTGAPYQDVLAALKMSSITGPNEAQTMWQRGMFSLLQWEALPLDFQQRAIRDLAGPIAGGFLDDSGLQLIRGVLGAKTPQARAQIAALLETQGVGAKALAAIGLGTSDK